MVERTNNPGLGQIVRLTLVVVGALLLSPVAAVLLLGLAIIGAPIALVGVPTRTVQSWATVARWAVIAVATAMLAPAALVTLVLAAFFLAPVALICIPFMVPVFFETAAHEHDHVIEHRALPAGRPAHA